VYRYFGQKTRKLEPAVGLRYVREQVVEAGEGRDYAEMSGNELTKDGVQ
jgi:hypothetical protein